MPHHTLGLWLSQRRRFLHRFDMKRNFAFRLQKQIHAAYGCANQLFSCFCNGHPHAFDANCMPSMIRFSLLYGYHFLVVFLFADLNAESGYNKRNASKETGFSMELSWKDEWSQLLYSNSCTYIPFLISVTETNRIFGQHQQRLASCFSFHALELHTRGTCTTRLICFMPIPSSHCQFPSRICFILVHSCIMWLFHKLCWLASPPGFSELRNAISNNESQ